jgi:hypothetical protein
VETTDSNLPFDTRGAKRAVVLAMAGDRSGGGDNEPLLPNGKTDADLLES